MATVEAAACFLAGVTPSTPSAASRLANHLSSTLHRSRVQSMGAQPHLQLLQGETTAQALLGVVLDGLATHHWLQGTSSRPRERSLGLLSACCKKTKPTREGQQTQLLLNNCTFYMLGPLKNSIYNEQPAALCRSMCVVLCVCH